MFNKLRNKLIIINLATTSIILIVAFSFIYFSSRDSIMKRDVIPDNAPEYSAEIRHILDDRIQKDRDESLDALLIELIVVGIAFELIIAVASYVLAENAIRPIKESYEKQKLFIANASHEIKTPLAAIQANLEASGANDNKWVKNAAYETEKLAGLNNQLLALAKADNAENQIKKEEVNLKKLIEKNVETISPRLKNQTIAIKGKTQKISINKTDFEEIFNILLDNAVKYSDKKIIIKLSEKYVEIENDGKKIKKEQLDQIFDRFYQVDKNTEGVGLGLSIAKSLAQKNGWDLSAKSSKNTAFKISFV